MQFHQEFDVHGPITGYDLCVVKAPSWIEHPPGGILNVARADRYFNMLSDYGAEQVDSRLHHADWVMTGDPKVVEAIGLTHDCAKCVAGVDQALTYLRENPDRKLLVGLLYWTN